MNAESMCRRRRRCCGKPGHGSGALLVRDAVVEVVAEELIRGLDADVVAAGGIGEIPRQAGEVAEHGAAVH